MSSPYPDPSQLFQVYLLQCEQQGLVTRTFRRLDPARQQAILQAILEEAAQRGPAGLNIKLVAQRAGVSVGSLYQYFGDREHMLDFAVELCVRSMIDMFDTYGPDMLELPLRQALEAYLMGGIEWSRMEAGFLHFFARAAYHGDPLLTDRLVRPIATVMRQMVEQMLARAAERGEVRQDVDWQAAARLINALMIAAIDPQLLPYLNAYFQVVDDSISPERLFKALLDLTLTGITPLED
jgi:AcrR family transcriptional regulator